MNKMLIIISLIIFNFSINTFASNTDFNVSIKSDTSGIRPDQDAINAVSPVLWELRETFNEKLKTNNKLSGTVDVLLEVLPSGKIISAKIIKNTLKDNVLTDVIYNFLNKKAFFSKVSIKNKNSIFKISFIFGDI